jgi:hypothetical protein
MRWSWHWTGIGNGLGEKSPVWIESPMDARRGRRLAFGLVAPGADVRQFAQLAAQ